jgi:hypothetical protein
MPWFVTVHITLPSLPRAAAVLPLLLFLQAVRLAAEVLQQWCYNAHGSSPYI